MPNVGEKGDIVYVLTNLAELGDRQTARRGRWRKTDHSGTATADTAKGGRSKMKILLGTHYLDKTGGTESLHLCAGYGTETAGA